MTDSPTSRSKLLSKLVSCLALAVFLLAPGGLFAAGCPDKPGLLVKELNFALRDLPSECDWSVQVSNSFPNNFGGGGTYNLPVLAAAIAYIEDPVRPAWNMNDWWRTYLQGELGLRGSLWYYGGQEVGSGNYQHYNILSVMAVHYQAREVGNAEIKLLARDWLRATFALHALSAAPVRPNTIHDRDNPVESFTGYGGPFVAMAGLRYSENHWQSTNRSILFARASGLGHNLGRESPEQANVRSFLEANWSDPARNVYGMTPTNQTHLQNVVSSGVISNTVASMWAGLHTVKKMHFVGWPGVRLTLIEENAHGSTVPTYGMVYFHHPHSGSGRELHVLYPWARSTGPGHRPFRRGITTGYAQLKLNVTRAIASNVAAGEAPESPHPVSVARVLDLPSSPPLFHVTLDP